jgi:lysozyme
MNIHSWINRQRHALFVRPAREQKSMPHRHPCRPVIEILEDRLAPALVYGLDVSYAQGTIDWNSVAGSGVDFQSYSGPGQFVYLKAAQGLGPGNNNSGWSFATNSLAARNQGLDVGAYDYANPDADDNLENLNSNNPQSAIAALLLDDANNEANYFAEVLQTSGYLTANHLQPTLDLEDDTGSGGFDTTNFTWTEISTWVTDWIGKLQSDIPAVSPILYMNQNYAQNLGAACPSLTKYPLWVAVPNNNPNFTPNVAPWASYSIMQWTFTGSADGINGNVDLDVVNPSIIFSSLAAAQPSGLIPVPSGDTWAGGGASITKVR